MGHLACSKKPFKHELGGGEYWENEALRAKIDGFGTRYNGDEKRIDFDSRSRDRGDLMRSHGGVS